MTEEHRIKIAAAEWAYDKVDVSAYQGYIAGAKAELELMTEQLKKERNKVIDGVIDKMKKVESKFYTSATPAWSELKNEIESLKH